MTENNPLRHMHDDASRKAITALCEAIAMALIEREIWRAPWRVEIDGCVFKFKIEGYAKYGTERRKRLDAERAALSAEADEYERGANAASGTAPAEGTDGNR